MWDSRHTRWGATQDKDRIPFHDTASPCYFAHRDGGHYYITNTTEKLSRQVKFNVICPINYNKRLWKIETIGSRILKK